MVDFSGNQIFDFDFDSGMRFTSDLCLSFCWIDTPSFFWSCVVRSQVGGDFKELKRVSSSIL